MKQRVAAIILALTNPYASWQLRIENPGRQDVPEARDPVKFTAAAAALFLLAAAVPGFGAQNGFDGTWRVDLQHGEFGGKPSVQSLRNGVFRCDTCVPKIQVKADGQDHPKKDDPYSDTITVREINDRSVETIGKKNGQVVGRNLDTVSSDGNTLTSEWSYVPSSGKAESGKTISKRVGPAPPKGSNQISGSWQAQKLENASENIMRVTFKSTEDGLSMRSQSGGSFTAKFDGKDYPYEGDPGISTVVLKKMNENAFEESDKRNGKVVSIAKWTLSPDGKILTVEGQDKLGGGTFKWTANKE